MGKLVALGLQGYKDIIVDGSSDPKLRDSKGQVPDDYKICIRNNGDIKFANLNFWEVKGESDNTDHVDHDLSKFGCEHTGITRAAMHLINVTLCKRKCDEKDLNTLNYLCSLVSYLFFLADA